MEFKEIIPFVTCPRSFAISIFLLSPTFLLAKNFRSMMYSGISDITATVTCHGYWRMALMIIKKDAKRITVNRSNSDHNYWAARYTYTVAGKEYCRKFSCSPLSSTRSHLRTIINVYWIDDPARPFWDYSEDPLGDLYNIFTTLFPWIVAILLILFLPGGADAVRQYQIPTISG